MNEDDVKEITSVLSNYSCFDFGKPASIFRKETLLLLA